MTDRRELSFDRVADEYERARASYPTELLDLLPLGADASVLDLAAGTGKLTRILVERYRTVTAVEPLANMRAMLERVVPGVSAYEGTAEQIPLRDAAVDGVFAAQAFHWFDKELALPEIARVLRPCGVLAIVWNAPDESRPDPRPPEFVRRMSALHEAAPGRWKTEPEWEVLLADSGFFSDVQPRQSVPHDHVLDRDGLIDNLRSTSWIANRDDRGEVIAEFAALVPEGTYAVPNEASVIWATKR